MIKFIERSKASRNGSPSAVCRTAEDGEVIAEFFKTTTCAPAGCRQQLGNVQPFYKGDCFEQEDHFRSSSATTCRGFWKLLSSNFPKTYRDAQMGAAEDQRSRRLGCVPTFVEGLTAGGLLVWQHSGQDCRCSQEGCAPDTLATSGL